MEGGKEHEGSSARSEGVSAVMPVPAATVLACRKRRRENMEPPICIGNRQPASGLAIIGGLSFPIGKWGLKIENGSDGNRIPMCRLRRVEPDDSGRIRGPTAVLRGRLPGMLQA